MAQFRLTAKFAADMKINRLNSPKTANKILDDWAIDIFRVQRKKVAMITHVGSYFTFFIPYRKVGGAKDIPNWISVMVSHYLAENGRYEEADDAKGLLDSDFFFCKTDSRKLLGHMNDLRNCATCFVNQTDFDSIDWDDITESINHTLIQFEKNVYKRPSEIFFGLFSEKKENIVTIH